jgi:MYXO-CTERM domain-containing protein
MFTRRIVASVCALALAVPAVASAKPAFDGPVAYGGASVGQGSVSYGDTKYDLQNKQDLAPKGDTKNDVTPSYADRVGSLTAAQLAAAYGTTMPKATPIASPAASSTDDGTDGWRIAAVVEAGLLAAIALAGAAFVARRRPQRSVTA